MGERYLEDLFREGRTAVIEWEGVKVYSALRVCPFLTGLTISLELGETADGLQGVSLSCQDAVISINGVEGKNFVLWEESAPDVVTVSLRKIKPAAELLLWNVWDRYGHTDAWLLNAGMVIDELTDRSAVVACGEGEGPVRFTDLTIRLNWADCTEHGLEACPRVW